ncbi:MAG: hypothetical protein LBJ78_03120 [Puniceicoccales bacterium]|jgi:hypothetical protein|nr:hypothetical protein [Puniceicoccales bacterium]
MAINVDMVGGELSPVAHVRVQKDIFQMEIANRCAELGGQASITSIREGIRTYVGLALKDPALAAQLICDGHFLGFVNGFVGDKHGEEAVYALKEALTAYQGCGLGDYVVQELKNELDRFTLENFGKPSADLTVDETLNKSNTINCPFYGPWGPTFEPYRDCFLGIGSDAPEGLLKENLIKIIWLAGEAEKSLMGEVWSFYRIHEDVKFILEVLGMIPEVTPKQKLMAVQVLTDLYVGNALEAAQGSLEALQDGPLASCCFVQGYANPYFPEEERQWIADTILRCKYLDPKVLRISLDFSNEAHSLESVSSIIAIVNTLRSLSEENRWVQQTSFINVGLKHLPDDYYLCHAMMREILKVQNPSLEWWFTFTKDQCRKFHFNFTKETYLGKTKAKEKNQYCGFFRSGGLNDRYPKGVANMLKFLDAAATSNVPTSFPNIPIIGANLSKLQLVKTSDNSHEYRMRMEMSVYKANTYFTGIGLFVEAPYMFSNETYATGTLNWVRNYNWLMHQLWPSGMQEIPAKKWIFFDKENKQYVEKEVGFSYESKQWDYLSTDIELYGKSVHLRKLTSDSNAPDITFIPSEEGYPLRYAFNQMGGRYNVNIESH